MPRRAAPPPGGAAEWADEGVHLNDDQIIRARVLLLGTDEPSLHQKVWAYRLLAPVSPAVYLPRLTRALVSFSHEVRHDHRAVRTLLTEALDAADALHADDPGRVPALFTALDALRSLHHRLGDRAEALTTGHRLADLARSSGTPYHLNVALLPLATHLAEDGRPGEAADLLRERALRVRDSEPYLPERAAMLAAAGRLPEALALTKEDVAERCAKAAAGNGAYANAVLALLRQARLLDRSARPDEARAARAEAASQLRRLVEHGENRGCLPHASRCTAQLAAPDPDRPGPAYGMHDHDWSPAARAALAERLAHLQEQVDAHGPPAEADPAAHLATLTRLHRLLTAWTAVRVDRQLEPVLPLADGTVALAELLTAHGLDPDGTVLADALLDRACLLTALRRPADALADLTRAAG